MRAKNIFQMFLTAMALLLIAPSVWAITNISAVDAYNNVRAGTGVLIDVRTVEEHNSCNAAWAGTTNCPNSETANWGAPQWTDTATGVLMLGLNIPYWWQTTSTGQLPEDPAQFAAFFEELRLAGTISYDTPIYLICRSGMRSYYGGVYIESLNLGYTNIYTVDSDTNPDNNAGGMLEWSAAGLPKHTSSINGGTTRGWVPPQVSADSPANGYTQATTDPITFTARIIAPPWGRGFNDLFPVIRVSLYIDGVFVEDATITTPGDGTDTDPIGAQQFYTFSPQTLTADTHTWNVRAENEVTFNNTVPGEVGWNLHTDDHTDAEAGLFGPGERTLTVTAPSVDTDGDGIPDSADNCTLVANADQRDTDGDNYGNICDPDFDQSGLVNAADLFTFKANFFTADPDADLDGSGLVNAADLFIFKSMFFQAPGPSGLAP